jgi:hypothetical protein
MVVVVVSKGQMKWAPQLPRIMQAPDGCPCRSAATNLTAPRPVMRSSRLFPFAPELPVLFTNPARIVLQRPPAVSQRRTHRSKATLTSLRSFSRVPSRSLSMLSKAFLLAAVLATHVAAQDGSVSAPTSSADAAGYNCDPTKCKLPTCNCASTSPPGGLSPVSKNYYA